MTKSFVRRLAMVLSCSVCSHGPALAVAATIRVSVASDGSQGNESGSNSSAPSVSSDGRYVAFDSAASNLVPEDANSHTDIFLRDTMGNATTLLSVASDGIQGNGDSGAASLSGDARYAAFESMASNLVAGDDNGWSDVFVRDRVAGMTTRVSVASGGTQANNHSYDPSLSANGRYVAFESLASNLVTGDTNTVSDIFIRDTATGITMRVSVATDGTQANGSSYDPSISADGRYVAFASLATNLVSGDANASSDIFVRDTVMNTTTRASVSSEGTAGDGGSFFPCLSANGRYVAFESASTNLVAGDGGGHSDVFLRDLVANTTTRVSVGVGGTEANGDSGFSPWLSADGRYVAFQSSASNLVANDTNGNLDVFVWDTAAQTTTLVSVASDGTQGNSDSGAPAISGDGRYVAFLSFAANLVVNDTNEAADVFLHGPLTSSAAFTPTDVRTVLRIAGGFDTSDTDTARYDLDQDGRLTLLDALRLARKVAGLEPNP